MIMISSSNKNVEIKGNSMEVIEDFALIVFELQKIFGREDLINFFAGAIAASDLSKREE
jgi:hypothetical protein